MSDFDDVLERLLTEPPFAAALASDPDLALTGYRLDEDEVALLRSQVVGDSAADVAKVETRTNKSSMFGLLAPFAALGGLADSVGQALAADPGHTSGFGANPETSGAGGSALGAAPSVHAAMGEPPVARAAFGEAPVAHAGFGAPAHAGLGSAPDQGFGGRPLGHAEEAHLAGYHDRVDADGDGTWDHATYRAAPDGGVDILVDLNHDGRADFIGHDANLDHKVEYADYDTDHDGVFEKRIYDDDHDGWLDRTVRRHPKHG
jgi:hypothetical protein